MTQTKFILALFLINIFGLASISAACPTDKALVIGFEVTEPLQVKEKNGSITGIDIEILKLVLQKMNCKFTFSEMPWARSLEEMQKGEIDILAGATITSERQAYAFFSKGYSPKSFTYVYAPSSKGIIYAGKTLGQLAEVKSLTIGVGRGYEYGDIFDEAKKNPKFVSMLRPSNDLESLLKKLASRRVEVAIFDEISLKYLAKKLKLSSKVEATDIVVDSSESFFMFGKKNLSPEFLAEFNTVLEQIRKSKEYQAILSKYF